MRIYSRLLFIALGIAVLSIFAPVLLANTATTVAPQHSAAMVPMSTSAAAEITATHTVLALADLAKTAIHLKEQIHFMEAMIQEQAIQNAPSAYQRTATSQLLRSAQSQTASLSQAIDTGLQPDYTGVSSGGGACTVTNTKDSGSGSLRRCMQTAGISTTIDFDPTAFLPLSPVTISLQTPLPWIVTPGLTIDGSNAGVVLDGSGLADGNGFVITGTHGVTIQGLQIVKFPRFGVAMIGGTENCIIGGSRAIGAGPLGQGNLISGNGFSGVLIQENATKANRVFGNYIGTNIAGNAAWPNGGAGVLINGGTSKNIIGGNSPSTRNLLSGNTFSGVELGDSGTTENEIGGNYIGTDVNGVTALSNGGAGIYVRLGASGNLLGAEDANMRNVVSGNVFSGIQISGDGTNANKVVGNYIGLGASGTITVPNNQHGILISLRASKNIVGGVTPTGRNVISGNTMQGVTIGEAGTVENIVANNYVGTDATGAQSLANGGAGISIILGASKNIVGGTTENKRNLISGNTFSGIELKDVGTTENVIIGNQIGTDATGTQMLRNGGAGIFITLGASKNTIGGTTENTRNLISGNTFSGVQISGEDTAENVLIGNYIGTDVDGLWAIANGVYGVYMSLRTQRNVIGGNSAGERNIISGNFKNGIGINESSANIVSGNFIGTTATGLQAVPNGEGGVFIGPNSRQNQIGGESVAMGNLISGNLVSGIAIGGEGATENVIIGNIIGATATGLQTLPNGGTGITIALGAKRNKVGGNTNAERNVISGNAAGGIGIGGEETSENLIVGNYIGTDVSGLGALPNGENGILIGLGARKNQIGGSTSIDRNLISGNLFSGIAIGLEGAEENVVIGNYIGTEISGTQVISNGYNGIFLASGAMRNRIGGNVPGERNLISGNFASGIEISGNNSSENIIIGNYIGTDVNGTQPLANNSFGIFISASASKNRIGGETEGERNLISGNGLSGIILRDNGTTENVISGNYIGTNISGIQSLPNGEVGVFITLEASKNTIGGTIPAAGNLISGNNSSGVEVSGVATAENLIIGNLIGVDITASKVIGNQAAGISLNQGANHNQIGSVETGGANLIGGNKFSGVILWGEGTIENSLVGNSIGTDHQAVYKLPNEEHGVYIAISANSNTIGISNTIAFNQRTGVAIEGQRTVRNQITRNAIYSNSDGTVVYFDHPHATGGAPVIQEYRTEERLLLGESCGFCQIEFYANPDPTPAATIYLGTVTAEAQGSFQFVLPEKLPLSYVSVSATDANRETSEFSAGFAIPQSDETSLFLPFITR